MVPGIQVTVKMQQENAPVGPIQHSASFWESTEGTATPFAPQHLVIKGETASLVKCPQICQTRL